MNGSPLVFNLMSAIPTSPQQFQQQQQNQQQNQNQQKKTVIEESLTFVLPKDNTVTSGILKQNIKQENRGLAQYFFDKRTRKRKYISLTGKKETMFSYYKYYFYF